MIEIFTQLIRNHVLVVTVIAWFFTQFVKVILGVVRERRFDFRWFIGTGGMPSSHAAGASALATSIGLSQGFDSVIFALAATFCVVVFFDAQGVRMATGRQAHILNHIMEDIYFKGRIQERRLKELIGHTPMEVIFGIIIGVLLAMIFY
ncbi:MAG: divergent PAP2 family protein [Candidatus Omnitrophica bacterium]|nr:divergent PAP2 family protein [Candidatus Omnitrophota bacterium]